MRALTTADMLAVQARAASTVGEHEQPMGSNRTRFGANLGTNGLAWCMAWNQTMHEEVLGKDLFHSKLVRTASCYMAERDAQRRGIWLDAKTHKAKQGYIGLMLWQGDSIVHHTFLCTADSPTIGRAEYIAGNESDMVRRGVRTSQIHGYIDLGYTAYKPPASTPAKPTSLDLGAPPRVLFTQEPRGKHNDLSDIKYIQRGLNFVLPQWGHAFKVTVDGKWTTSLTLGLAAYKHYANQKQWQWYHRPGGREPMPERMFHDESDGKAGPRTLAYLRLSCLAPNPMVKKP